MKDLAAELQGIYTDKYHLLCHCGLSAILLRRKIPDKRE